MDLTVRDVTRLFQVSEKTVYRWIREKGLAAYLVQDQYRFSRAVLLEWARTFGLTIPPGFLGDETPQGLALTTALTAGGIYYNIPGSTKEEVFSAIAQQVRLPASFSAEELKKLLLAREALSSTGIGHGVAVPHVRDPIVLPIEAAAISVCFLKTPLDFDAIDGKAVHTFFLLLSPTIRDHLKLLSKVAYVLHDAALLNMLVRRETEGRLLDKIREMESGMKPEGGT